MANVKDPYEVKSKFNGSKFGNGVIFSNEPLRNRNDNAGVCGCKGGGGGCASFCDWTGGGSGCGSTNKIKVFR